VILADIAIVGFTVLTASFVAACGVIWKALRSLWRAVHDLEARLRRLHDLSDPE